MRRVELTTGVDMAVHEQGTGERVLVLLHAWGETHRVFDRLLPLLPMAARVLVPDQRGVGDTSKPVSGYSLVDAAADVVALMDALGISDCWLVGTSSGGYVAQQIALDHPHRVRGLVLVGSPRDLRKPLPAGFAEFLSLLNDPVTADDVERLGIPLHSTVPHDFVAAQTAAAASIPARVWRATLEGLQAAVPPTEQGVIAVPTLVLWGEEEDLLPPGEGRELAAAIPGSRLVTYGGTGHLVLVEQPERVARDIADFITSST